MTQTDTNRRDWGRLKRLALECEKYGGLRTPEYEAAANPATVLELIAEVERLRANAEKMEKLYRGLSVERGDLQAEFIEMRSERDALKSQRDEMAEALGPFAIEASMWVESASDHERYEMGEDREGSTVYSTFTVGDLRRARSSLNKTEKI